MASKEALEKAARIRNALAKKEKRLPILVQESQLYDWDSAARLGIPRRKRGRKPKTAGSQQ